MLSAMTWNGSAPAFAALPNGQYAMPVMPPMQMAHDDHGKKRKSRGDDSDGKRKHKKPRDPNAPKRPPSSYLIFQNDIRAELKAKNPGMRNNELLSAISKLWSEMPQDQKDVCVYVAPSSRRAVSNPSHRNTRRATKSPRMNGWRRRRSTKRARMVCPAPP